MCMNALVFMSMMLCFTNFAISQQHGIPLQLQAFILKAMKYMHLMLQVLNQASNCMCA